MVSVKLGQCSAIFIQQRLGRSTEEPETSCFPTYRIKQPFLMIGFGLRCQMERRVEVKLEAILRIAPKGTLYHRMVFLIGHETKKQHLRHTSLELTFPEKKRN